MFWMFFWAYIAVGLFVAGPILTKRLYAVQYDRYYTADGKPNTTWGYTSKARSLGREGQMMTDKELQEFIWDMDRAIIPLAMLGAFVWPISLYAVTLRYAATHRQVKEAQRKAEQKEREVQLQQAYELVEKHKKEIEENFDHALGDFVGGVKSLQKRTEKGRIK